MKKLSPSMSWIVRDDDPIIRTKAQICKFPLNDEDQKFLEKMIAYVDASYDDLAYKYNIRPGVAIAANQVGWLKQVIYLHFDDEFGKEVHWCLANPEITKKSDEITYLSGGEGCLSVPNDHSGVVPRISEIEVKAFDMFNNKEILIKASGYRAIVLQHEIDHLNGILYYDHINIIDPHFTNNEWKKL